MSLVPLDAFCAVADENDAAKYPTSRCEPFDNDMCGGAGTAWDSQFPVNCRDLAWCDFFCGAACDRGEGGLCFLEHISSLGATCQAVSERVVSLQGDPALLDRSHALGPNHDDAFLDHAAHPGDHDGGCGAYAICTHCTGDCVKRDTHSYFFSLLGESVDTPAIAPPANVKFALGDAVSTCDHFSLLTDDARAYRTHIPKASRGGETDLGSTKGRGGSAWAAGFVNVAVVVVVLVTLALAAAFAAKLLRQKGLSEFLRRKWRGGGSGGGGSYAPVDTKDDPTAGLDAWRISNSAAESQKSLLRHTHVYGAFVNQHRGATTESACDSDDDTASECGSDVVVL